MLRLTRGFCLVFGRPWAGPAREAPGKTESTAKGNGAERPRNPDHGRTKLRTNGGQERPQDFRRVCFQLMGEATTAFQNLYGNFGAAEGKVPLLMVCVKPKPQHLVFKMSKGESRIIIPGFCLCRMPETRASGGFERCRGGGRPSGTMRPGAIWGRIDVPPDEATRGGRGRQGAGMVQLRWTGVGGVEKRSGWGGECTVNCASRSTGVEGFGSRPVRSADCSRRSRTFPGRSSRRDGRGWVSSTSVSAGRHRAGRRRRSCRRWGPSGPRH
jgi:hypothetical protein